MDNLWDLFAHITMKTRAYVLLFLAVLSTAGEAAAQALTTIAPAPVLFVLPRLAGNGDFALANDAAGDILLADEVAPDSNDKVKKVSTYLAGSAAWDLGRRLYGLASKNSGSPGVLALAVTELLGETGPQHVPQRMRVHRIDGTDIDLPSFIVLWDLGAPAPGTHGPNLTLDLLVQNDYLGLVLVHEMAHQIMADRYDRKKLPSLLSESRDDHDVNQVTDPNKAFSEGWAEAFEALVADLLEASGQTPKMDDKSLQRMRRAREDWLEADKYIWENQVKHDGDLLNGLQMTATEGVVGSLVYQAVASRKSQAGGLVASLAATFDLLGRSQPAEVIGFYQAAIAGRADLKNILIRIFLEQTRYATVDAGAQEAYRASFEATEALRRTVGAPDRQALRKDKEQAAATYKAWREARLAAVLAGKPLDAALPPNHDPLWVDDAQSFARVGLNLATPARLSQFMGLSGLTGDHILDTATKVVALRDGPGKAGFFRSVDDAAAADKDLGALLVKDRQVYVDHSQPSPAPAATAAFLGGPRHLRLHADVSLDLRLQRYLSGQ